VEENILHNALLQLEKLAGLQAEWDFHDHDRNGVDATVEFRLDGNRRIWRNAEVKTEIRHHHIAGIIEKAHAHKPFLLIVKRLYPNLKKMLNDAGIDWLDAAGNIRLRDKDLLIWIDRHATTPETEKKNRAFTKTGLKVVFLFLHDEVWLNRTYREIANAADVALGNIKYVLDGLKEHGFVIRETKKQLKLINKKELLDAWITAFMDELKPKIRAGTWRFIDEGNEENWREMDLGANTVWGGEPAADLITGNLRPLKFTLYTTKKKAELMRDLKLQPDENGNVEIIRPYWTIENTNFNTAPHLAIYTDLMMTGDPRNAKIAREIYEKFIAG
jgi:hypothetical protein